MCGEQGRSGRSGARLSFLYNLSTTIIIDSADMTQPGTGEGVRDFDERNRRIGRRLADSGVRPFRLRVGFAYGRVSGTADLNETGDFQLLRILKTSK
jgi:hypothetical protein